MSKILVTGGVGFIGSHIALELTVLGHDVITIDDLSGGTANIVHGVDNHMASITDAVAIDSIFAEHNFDYVFHAAAYAAEGLSPFIRKFNYETNLIGSINLINSSIKYKVKHFTFLSSIAVYGEESMIEGWGFEKPIDPYGISKLATEMDLFAANKQFGLNYTIFRPHNVYGERQNLNDPFRNVVGIFMRRKLLGESVTVFGDGMQTRSFTYVGDIVPAICESITNIDMLNKTFNIGSDDTYTISDLVRLLNLEKVEYVEERHEVKHTIPDHRLINDVTTLGNTPLKDGLDTMWRWAQIQDIKPYTKPNFNLEITKGLPQSWKSLI